MSRFLDECMKFIDTQPFDIIRMSEVVGDGEIETVNCKEVAFCQNIYSGAKAYAMTAIGILYDQGRIRMEDKVCDILREFVPESGMDERWEKATVHMAIKHELGLPGGFLDIDVQKSSEFTEDFLHYLFTYPLAYTPGTESRYADGSTYVLSRLVSAVTGEKLDDFLWRELLIQMDFQEMAWSHCPKGYPIGATGMYLNSSDMVKLGLLYLNGGLYNGRRLLSEEWVKMVLDREYVFEWDPTHTFFFKGGMYGQKLTVIPGQNRVFAMQAFGANSDVVSDWARDYKD